ncbi:MAG: hypothetical protein P8020_02330 [Acidobacteriota bacterium]
MLHVTLRDMDPDEARGIVLAYHRRSEHTLTAYALSLGYLDWASQPDPFRHFEGTEKIPLAHPAPSDSPPYAALGRPHSIPPAKVDHDSISRLLYDSLSLSAWKQAEQTRWSLRVDPSSGNLHPTEAYLTCPPCPALCNSPVLFHYDPSVHALERRLILSEQVWEEAFPTSQVDTLLVGLSSIYWRESWKYGERAFRYCQLDLGHALGCVAVAAAGLGWSARLVGPLPTGILARLLGTHEQEGPEAERAEALIVISPRHRQPPESLEAIRTEKLAALPTESLGDPSQLSVRHFDWPVVDEVAAATEVPAGCTARYADSVSAAAGPPAEEREEETGRSLTIRTLVRQRRSALAMDGVTSLGRDAFLHIMHRCMPGTDQPPQDILPWPNTLSIACFVHRVRDMEPGLYFLLRCTGALDDYRSRLDPAFVWEPVDWRDRPPSLFLLKSGDYRARARQAACGQEIASDGVASFAMIGDLRSAIALYGAWFYRRLFWEAGLLGQILYLEAEAAGIRGTGIGCYLDDVTRNLLGVKDRDLECFYHFTVGVPLEDPRLQSLPAYWHIQPSSG